MPQRLQKLLAEAGVASRRGAEKLISEGRVTVNGAVAELGQKADHTDRITVNGRRVALVQPGGAAQVLMYNKPVGQIVSRNDPEHPDSVFDHLPEPASGRWISVGRLDLNTSGLLLFTNHGELASRLMHPRHEQVREYAVRVLGEVAPEVLKRLRNGIDLEDGPARFDEILFDRVESANQWYRVKVSEGRNRLVRRLWESQGLQVSRLMRIRYGDISLPRDLRGGQSRLAFDNQVEKVMKSVGLSSPRRRSGNR